MKQDFRPETEQTRQFATPDLNVTALISLFHSLFAEQEQTVLVSGANEPLYAPKDIDHKGKIVLSYAQNVPLDKHRIYFRHDYVSSLLHEVAHWCIAGDERRLQLDYGYWYAPDGRDIKQQALFEQVEVKPQAIEKLFSQACGIEFRISMDNLLLDSYDTGPFESAVIKQANQYQSDGMPERAQVFFDGIHERVSQSHA